MSAALDACHDWQRENRELMWTLEGRDRDELLFMAGYVRGLEDFAADPCDRNRDTGITNDARHYGTIYANLARARAAAVAPRETKD